MELKFCKTLPDAVLPSRAHPEDAGLDLTPVSIVKNLSASVVLYDTGLAVAPEEGYHTEIVPRSSSSKIGVSLANNVGIIDRLYRGNLLLAIRFHESIVAPESLLGARACQLIVRKTHIAEPVWVDNLDDTVRGSGGFGSSGNK
jgi:dUTP pyrophosphatase